MNLDFLITAKGNISAAFIQNGCTTFSSAATYIKNLPYKRNTNKTDVLAPLNDGFGTCSTKHVLLARLAIENNHPEIELGLGIFKMDKNYSKNVSQVLKKYNLAYIPEAHNYLLFDNQRWDYTTAQSAAVDFENELMDEVKINPLQLNEFKVTYHKAFLDTWRKSNYPSLNLDELWQIREECIAALAMPNN
jgi:hypothetical protein